MLLDMNKNKKNIDLQTNKLFFLLPALIFIAISCAKENDSLVNPPTIYETVKVRFLNFASDREPRTLILENTLTIENISYNSISNAEIPPFDSVNVSIKKNNILELEINEPKQKFARNTRYIIMALPSPINSTNYKALDTIIKIQTTSVRPQDTNECYLKMFNANNNTDVSYTLRLGCPSDSLIIGNLTYKQHSGIKNIYNGKRIFSIIKNINTINSRNSEISSQLLGIYELDLKACGQYAIIINSQDEIFFIDELSDETNILLPPKEVEQKTSFCRIINLSSEIVSVNKTSEIALTTNLNSNFIDKYSEFPACDNLSKDKIQLFQNGIVTDSIYSSFAIGEKFSVLVFNSNSSNNSSAKKLIMVPPAKSSSINPSSNTSGKATVRIVNGNYTSSGITVSVGARSTSTYSNTNTQTNNNYISGEVLASGLSHGEVSKTNFLPAGTVPIAIFTSTEPAVYLFSSNIYLEADKNYILAVDFSDNTYNNTTYSLKYKNSKKTNNISNANLEGKLIVIEDSQEMLPIEYSQQSAFLQILNVVNNSKNVSVSIPDILDEAKLNYTGDLATFIPEGNNTITINGVTRNFTASKEKRILIIATGTVQDTEIFDIQSDNLGASETNYKRRFINASPEVPILQIKSDTTEQATIFAKNILYKTSSEVETLTKEKKFVLYFYNQETNNKIYTASDLMMTLRKNYSVIFFGNGKSGYGVSILQQY